MSARPVKDVLREAMVQAVHGMFEDYGVPLAEGDGDTYDVAAVLGFSGDVLRGSLGVAASLRFAAGSYEKVLDQPPTPHQLEDWMAEISNQVLGRVKNSLLRYDTTILLAIPSVLRGLQLRVGGTHDVQLLHTSYSSPWGGISVWIDPRHEAGLMLTESELPEEQFTSEGDMLMFF